MPKNVLLSKEDLYKWRNARWKCRTDLHYLSKYVLNYKDIETNVHGPVLDILQKFPVPKNLEEFEKNELWNGKQFVYRPLLPMQKLPGGRRVLILDPRGHLKTTINAQSHTIQWILNYPDTAIAIWQSNGYKAELILKEVKHHFQFNDKLRELFPELCPQKNPQDFGTKEAFTIPGRSPEVSRREPTVMALSIEKGTAGLHFDVMKFSDIVEPENVKTPERIKAVKDAFEVSKHLLVSPPYWIDVEGTRYNHNDLYGELMKQWMKEHNEKVPHEYKVMIRGVYRKIAPKDGKLTYSPIDFELPDLLVEGKKVPLWPTDANGPRFPLEALEASRLKDPYIFSCQMLNNPIGGIGGVEIFPLDKMQEINRVNFRRNIRISSVTFSIDTAETNNVRSNYSTIVVAAWAEDGRCYVADIIHGKWLPDELIKQIFRSYLKYKPVSIKMEKTSFTNGLMAGITREMDMRSLYLPIELVPRDNQQTKEERIQKTLQPYYINGNLRFVKPDIEAKFRTDDDLNYEKAYIHLKEELKTFPLGGTDDILDAISDLFQNKEWFGREMPRQDPSRDPFGVLSDGVRTLMTADMKRFLGLGQELPPEPESDQWHIINLPD